jgi:hypothetical protein
MSLSCTYVRELFPQVGILLFEAFYASVDRRSELIVTDPNS